MEHVSGMLFCTLVERNFKPNPNQCSSADADVPTECTLYSVAVGQLRSHALELHCNCMLVKIVLLLRSSCANF